MSGMGWMVWCDVVWYASYGTAWQQSQKISVSAILYHIVPKQCVSIHYLHLRVVLDLRTLQSRQYWTQKHHGLPTLPVLPSKKQMFECSSLMLIVTDIVYLP